MKIGPICFETRTGQIAYVFFWLTFAFLFVKECNVEHFKNVTMRIDVASWALLLPRGRLYKKKMVTYIATMFSLVYRSEPGNIVRLSSFSIALGKKKMVVDLHSE